MTATCGGCDRHWTAVSEAHCSACHCHFRNVTGFEAHRRDGKCLQPQSAGMEERDGTWATPEGHQAAQRSREALESARQLQRDVARG